MLYKTITVEGDKVKEYLTYNVHVSVPFCTVLQFLQSLINMYALFCYTLYFDQESLPYNVCSSCTI